MASSKPITKAKGRLTQAITAASTTISFTPTDTDRALTSVVMGDFGDVGYLVVNPQGSAANYMVVKFESWSVASGVITVGTLTVLELEGADTSATIKEFNAGTDVVIGTNHHWFNNYCDLGSAQTVAGVKTFSSLPATTAGDPVANNDLARKSYVDAQATGSATVNRVIVAGNGGEVLVAGDWVFLDSADNEWKKTDASVTATTDKIMVGVAQGAGTDGGAISNGVLISGVDDNQSGLTADTEYFLSDTAGEIATSAGTVERSVGMSISTTEILLTGDAHLLLTVDQQDALAGTSGTPSTSNKYVTDDDVAAAATANKVARRNATGDVTVPSTPTAGTDAASKTYVDAVTANSLESAVHTAVTVSNSAAETTLVQVSIPGGTLGTTNAVTAKLYFSDIDMQTTDTLTLRLKYGSTTIATEVITADSTITNMGGIMDAVVLSSGATGTQDGSFFITLGQLGSVDSGDFHGFGAGTGTATEDSTGALNLTITAQWSDAQVANTITMASALVESKKA